MDNEQINCENKKLCIDCKFLRRSLGLYYCYHPNNLDYVRNSPINLAYTCRESIFLCTHNGNWFEPKLIKKEKQKKNQNWWRKLLSF